MGGLSRQFLNLILDNRINGVRSLRCIDITRQHFFNITKPVASGQQKNKKEQAALKMGKIRLPSPSLSIRGSTSRTSDQTMHFLPVADRRVVCLDKLGHGVLLEADMHGKCGDDAASPQAQADTHLPLCSCS
ncbi:unnamed protein product [Urochloa humidicola]